MASSGCDWGLAFTKVDLLVDSIDRRVIANGILRRFTLNGSLEALSGSATTLYVSAVEHSLEHAGGRRFRLERIDTLGQVPTWQDLSLGENEGDRSRWIVREQPPSGSRSYRAALDE